jgi:molybdopterin molybdotransferase
MDDSDPSSLQIDDALNRILEAILPIANSDSVSIKSALYRVTAEDICATMDVPLAANSAMDGYAFHSADIPESGTRELNVIGTSWAGRPFDGTVSPGTCVRIMTGGILPEGADSVVMQENTQVTQDSILVDNRTRRGENVRPAGEDFKKGQTIISAGTRLTAAHLGLVASLGIAEINVIRKVRVAYFLTGDELRSIGDTIHPGEIYDSNRYTLFGMLSDPCIECTDLGIVKDDPDAIEHVMTEAEKNTDVILTTGGVSVGDADFVKDILEKRGRIDFWKVAIKPGRPLAFGKLGDALFFGLPGNPVSAMVTFYLLVRPALRHLMGSQDVFMPNCPAVSTANLKKRPGRVEYQRGILSRSDTGELLVSPTGQQGSGILSSMAEANCLMILPMENDGVVAGETVEVLPFFGLI